MEGILILNLLQLSGFFSFLCWSFFISQTCISESGSTNDGCWSGYTPSCGYNSSGYGETPSDPCTAYQPPQSALIENLDYSGAGGSYKTSIETEECHGVGYDPGGYWTTAGTTGTSYNYYPPPPPSQVPPPPQPPPPPPPPPAQHYGPSMVLYPSLYSTVNQNQIHLHVHNVSEYKPVEQYGDDVTTIVAPNNVTISLGGHGQRSMDTTEQVPNAGDQMTRYDRQHGDPSVWRPY